MLARASMSTRICGPLAQPETGMTRSKARALSKVRMNITSFLWGQLSPARCPCQSAENSEALPLTRAAGPLILGVLLSEHLQELEQIRLLLGRQRLWEEAAVFRRKVGRQIQHREERQNEATVQVHRITQRFGAVVVEVRCGVGNAAQRGHVERFEVVRATRDRRATWIGRECLR